MSLHLGKDLGDFFVYVALGFTSKHFIVVYVLEGTQVLIGGDQLGFDYLQSAIVGTANVRLALATIIP